MASTATTTDTITDRLLSSLVSSARTCVQTAVSLSPGGPRLGTKAHVVRPGRVDSGRPSLLYWRHVHPEGLPHGASRCCGEAARAVERAEIKDPRFQKFVDDMIETMHEYNGVGLAAPQVHEGLRVFVAMLDGGDDAEASVIINPVITPADDRLVEGWEGCLSIPDVRGRVPRSPTRSW